MSMSFDTILEDYYSTWAPLFGYLAVYYEVKKTRLYLVSHHMTEVFEFPNFYRLDYFGNKST